MKTLVIYEIIPEKTKLFVTDLEGERLEMYKQAHGTYINNDSENEATNYVNEDLVDVTEVPIVNGKPVLGPFELVIHTGFIL